MKKVFKRILAAALCLIMLFGTVSVGGNGLTDLVDTYASAGGADYSRPTIPFNVTSGVNYNLTIDWDYWNYFFNSSGAKTYNHNLALAAVALSRAAETSQSRAEKALGLLEFGNVKSVFYGEENEFLKPAVTFATIVCGNNLIVAIVCRGTDPDGKVDLLTDINAAFDGFDNAASNIYSEFKKYYDSLASTLGVTPTRSNTTFFITGHSLGGAMAQLMALKCEENGLGYRNKIFTYTFASPNVSVEKVDESVFTNIHNIINTYDLVVKS